MAPPKKPAPKPKPRAKSPPPAPKKIQAVEWYDFVSASRYLMSLFGQMGKLGLAAPGEDGHSLAPFHRDVLSEIMRWRDEHPNEAYDHLVNWRNLDVDRIVQRQQKLPRHETAKPRIEISVDVNRKDNLIVRWYPAGFFDRRPRYTRGRHYTPNLLDDCDFDDQPDFRWFVGDETGSWAPRPSNELMFIRGVGNLRIWDDDPRWGPHYGVAAVNALLIFAVRASFNAMVEDFAGHTK